MDLRVKLTKLEFTGQARGRHDGKLVFAWGGLPAETVTARVTRRQRRSFSCVVTEVHEAAAERVPPRESHYLSCSPWQVFAEEAELHWKAELVRDLFANQFLIALPKFEIVGGEAYGYRNKLEFSFTDTSDGLSLAFFERESFRHKLPLDGCLLGSEALNDTARHVRDVLRAERVPAEQLKSLVVRSNRAGQVAAALYVTEPIPPISDRVAELPGVSGFRVFLSNPQSPASVADALCEERGSAVLEETVLGRTFEYSDRSFFQINVPLFERAVRDMQHHVPAESPVCDLYAGVGTIGICLGNVGTRFVESDAETVAFLRSNCRRNSVPEPEILESPAEKLMDLIPAEATVILDPPRAGLHPKVLKRLAAALPRHILYLSCNPRTQAQDLVTLLAHYELTFFQAYNFFPRTPRVETLAVMEGRT
jgi:23S rRNA (uracil1939-C5)-methyltransferase